MDKSSLEYNVAWELEMWRKEEETRWRSKLLADQNLLLDKLTASWAKRKSDLELKVFKAEADVNARRRALADATARIEEKETQALIQQKQLELDRAHCDEDFRLKTAELAALQEELHADMARSKELITPRLNQAQQAIETLRQTIDYVQTQPEVRLRAAIAEAGRHVQELRKRLESLCNDCTKTREEAERLRAATSHSEMERHQLASRVRVLAEQRQHILLEAAARRTQIPLDELIKAKERLKGQLEQLLDSGCWVDDDPLLVELRSRISVLSAQISLYQLPAPDTEPSTLIDTPPSTVVPAIS